ncbi:MAG: TIGR02281 family clan AA aspartic protease [Rhodospirillales bacterium]
MIGWALRQLLQWTLLGVVCVGLYTHKDQLIAQLRSQGLSGPAAASGGGGENRAVSRSVRISAAANGHYFVDAEIDGSIIHFMVDTGATVVALNLVDADKLGIDPRERDFSETHQTANGLVRVAPVTLAEVRIGGIRLRNVDAVVNTRMRGPSLLGMSFLGRLGGFSVERGELILND